MARHCHSEWINAHPNARITTGESQLLRLAILSPFISLQDAMQFFDFLG